MSSCKKSQNPPQRLGEWDWKVKLALKMYIFTFYNNRLDWVWPEGGGILRFEWKGALHPQNN